MGTRGPTSLPSLGPELSVPHPPAVPKPAEKPPGSKGKKRAGLAAGERRPRVTTCPGCSGFSFPRSARRAALPEETDGRPAANRNGKDWRLCASAGTTVPDVLSAHQRGPAITRLRLFRLNYISRNSPYPMLPVSSALRRFSPQFEDRRGQPFCNTHTLSNLLIHLSGLKQQCDLQLLSCPPPHPFPILETSSRFSDSWVSCP